LHGLGKKRVYSSHTRELGVDKVAHAPIQNNGAHSSLLIN
jgi:hypothetical protein